MRRDVFILITQDVTYIAMYRYVGIYHVSITYEEGRVYIANLGCHVYNNVQICRHTSRQYKDVYLHHCSIKVKVSARHNRCLQNVHNISWVMIWQTMPRIVLSGFILCLNWLHRQASIRQIREYYSFENVSSIVLLQKKAT